jgi:anaerobic magnesium-protoporphyrin IX monomethyl ester cyclase
VALLFEDNFNYLSKMCLLRMREAAFRMIGLARDAGCHVIVCGADATDHHHAYLDRGAHHVLLGEGEATLIELLDHLEGRGRADIADVPGLVARVDGEVVHTGRRPVLRDLDALPHPARDLVDIDRYRRLWRERHGYFSMNLVASRGCPYHCNWCAKPIWGQRYHVRSPQDVAEEMASLARDHAPDHLWFADDILGLKPGWIEDWADALEARGVRVPFKCLSRPDLLLRGDTIEALARSGARSVWIGAESGSQKILDAMDKGTTVREILDATRRLRAHGIEVGYFLQFGYPGETRADIEATLDMVRRARPDDLGMSVSYPLPGTPFHASVRKELGTKQNWNDSNDLAMMYRGPFTTAFYRQLHTVLHKEFRMRRTWRRLRCSGPRPGPRELAAMAVYAATLPAARARLRHRATAPDRGLGPLPTRMTPAEAARPSPQGER